MAEPPLRAYRQRNWPITAQVQAGMRVGQGDLPGVRAQIGLLCLVAELQVLRAGRHH